jgi:uncharacterized membrane-anchored protein YitT (DUF2179 family)
MHITIQGSGKYFAWGVKFRMVIMGLRKIFCISFIVSSLMAFGAGIILHDWLVAVLVVFVVMMPSIHVAFNKSRPLIAGGYGGAVAGLGIALLFIFFGPIKFYA